MTADRCTYTRRTGTAAAARCVRTATRDGFCAKHHPDRARRRKPIALRFLAATLASATAAELAAVRRVLEQEEAKRAKPLVLSIAAAVAELIVANARLGAVVRPHVKHHPALGFFFIEPLLTLARSIGDHDTLDEALRRETTAPSPSPGERS